MLSAVTKHYETISGTQLKTLYEGKVYRPERLRSYQNSSTFIDDTLLLVCT